MIHMSFEKQLSKESKKKSIKNGKIGSWWRKNDYKVYRVILFYLWIPVWLFDKYKERRYSSLEFSEEYCKKCLDKILPKLITYHNEDPDCFLISDYDDYGYIEFSDLYRNYYPTKKCKREKEFLSKFSAKTRAYVIEKYEIDGYKKIVANTGSELISMAEKFGWERPYVYTNRTCVVFYKEK